MKNFMEGVFVPQEGDKIEDLKAINARIVEENKEISVYEISSAEVKNLVKWSEKRLESFAEAIAAELDKRRKKASN